MQKVPQLSTPHSNKKLSLHMFRSSLETSGRSGLDGVVSENFYETKPNTLNFGVLLNGKKLASLPIREKAMVRRQLNTIYGYKIRPEKMDEALLVVASALQEKLENGIFQCLDKDDKNNFLRGISKTDPDLATDCLAQINEIIGNQPTGIKRIFKKASARPLSA